MLYLGTTIASWILIGIASKTISAKLDTEGYDYIKSKKTKEEQRQENAKVILLMSIPIINILFAGYVTLHFDKLYIGLKKRWLEQGKIKKKEENKESKVEIDLNSNEINKTRKYSELSNEEKLRILEEEKAKLLRQEEKNESYNSRGAYIKRK
jgi:hypothetical protein